MSKKQSWLIKNRSELDGVIRYVEDRLRLGKSVRLTEAAGKRTLPQNALKEVWYGEVAKQKGDMTVNQIKRESKLVCGVPILRAENADFRRMYDLSIKNNAAYQFGMRLEDGTALSGYELKLLMMDILPVTSLMTTDQLSSYLESMQQHWAQCGAYLAFPDDLRRTDYPEARRA